jgi:hypothetical protein
MPTIKPNKKITPKKPPENTTSHRKKPPTLKFRQNRPSKRQTRRWGGKTRSTCAETAHNEAITCYTRRPEAPPEALP